MKYISPIALCACFLASGLPIASAQGLIDPPKSVKHKGESYTLPAGLTEEMLAPPPVPHFMLKKPATPLSIEEMLQQAREAEKSVKTTKPVPVNK